MPDTPDGSGTGVGTIVTDGGWQTGYRDGMWPASGADRDAGRLGKPSYPATAAAPTAA